jgi:hypothetical protein
MRGRNVTKRRARAAAMLLLVFSATMGAAPSSAAQEELPNLAPLKPYDIQIGIPDGEEYHPDGPEYHPTGALRFSVAVANRGEYGMEVMARPDHVPTGANDDADARQCIDWIAHRICKKRVSVGRFVYHAEPTHHHYHFEDFGAYELRALDAQGMPDMSPDGLVAGGQKISFCLEDVNRDSPAPTSPVKGNPNYLYYASCIGTLGIQGISPGWQDVYDYGLEGQQILLTGVPDGTYALVVTVDPTHRLHETTTEDNMAYQAIILSAAGTVVNVPDES